MPKDKNAGQRGPALSHENLRDGRHTSILEVKTVPNLPVNLVRFIFVEAANRLARGQIAGGMPG
jgi:hypothetical protein